MRRDAPPTTPPVNCCGKYHETDSESSCGPDPPTGGTLYLYCFSLGGRGGLREATRGRVCLERSPQSQGFNPNNCFVFCSFRSAEFKTDPLTKNSFDIHSFDDLDFISSAQVSIYTSS